MKRRILILLLFIAGNALAQSPFLTEEDTIHTFSSPNGELLFEYTVQEGETLYSIGKYFENTINEIKGLNPKIILSEISPGQQIVLKLKSEIVYDINGICDGIYDEIHAALYVPIIYTVKKGDTLFNISKRKFNTKIEYIKFANGLNSDEIQQGMDLLVAFLYYPELNTKQY